MLAHAAALLIVCITATAKNDISHRSTGGYLSIYGPDGRLRHQVPLEASTGRWRLPPGTTAAVIDIGARADTPFAGRLAREPNLFMIAVEPNLTFEALRASIAKLPNADRRRTLLLNVALGPTSLGSFATLSTGDWHDGACGSLMRRSRQARVARGGIHDACMQHTRNVTVPVLPLEALLAPFNDGFVDDLKVDAQGVDLSILKSGGDHLSRVVRRVTAEVQAVSKDSPLLLYEGQPTKDDVVDFMRQRGFILTGCDENGKSAVREQNCHFCNERLVRRRFFGLLGGGGCGSQ